MVARLTERADFLAARRGQRANGPLFFVEMRARGDGAEPRVGFTVTRKVGNAVERNRIRRRLREAVRLHAGPRMRPGTDYVIVARRETLRAPFARIVEELCRRVERRKGREGGAKGV